MDEQQTDIEAIQKENEHLKYKLGKQSEDVGELRKLVDQYILKEEVNPDKYAEDPIGTMEKLMEQKVKPLQEKISSYEESSARQKLEQAHPDYESVVQDPGFQEWVKSSNVRTAAFQSAVSGNLEAGIDLIGEFKNAKPNREAALDVATAQNKGGSRDTGVRESNFYKRADIIRKKIEDPQWYRAHQDEIMAAYREGRVK